MAQSTAPDAGKSAAKAATVTHITKAQAEELFKSVDEIMQFASDDSKLKIQRPIKKKLITREVITKYVQKKFNEDKSSQRLQRSEIVLKKFGLLDHDFQLRPFLTSLLTEQIAGYYDAKTKTVNLLDWIPPDEQKPVMAHELTHALQDQRVDLQKWDSVTLEGISKDTADDNRHIATDETDTAREAVVEGQAMLVFIDYSLRGTGKTLLSNPQIVGNIQDAMTDSSDSPVMARAPLVLQQSLVFPYREGLAFEYALLAKSGAESAFAGTLERPPSTSFEVMNPEAYLVHAPQPLLPLPDVHSLLDKDYRPYDVGVMGSLDVRMLSELFAGLEIASALAPEWNGGIYYAAQRRSAVTAEEKNSTASLGLLYYSRWKNEDSARTFLRVYAEELPRKYSGLKRRNADEKSADEQVYTSSEGDVYLHLAGEGLFVSEGFDLAVARQLAEKIEGAQSSAPLRQVKWSTEKNSGELCAGLVRELGRFGVMKAGLAH